MEIVLNYSKTKSELKRWVCNGANHMVVARDRVRWWSIVVTYLPSLQLTIFYKTSYPITRRHISDVSAAYIVANNFFSYSKLKPTAQNVHYFKCPIINVA